MASRADEPRVFTALSSNLHALLQQKGTPTECTVKSEDIEREYQRNAAGSMLFQVMGRQYRLDFGGRVLFY